MVEFCFIKTSYQIAMVLKLPVLITSNTFINMVGDSIGKNQF